MGPIDIKEPDQAAGRARFLEKVYVDKTSFTQVVKEGGRLYGIFCHFF
jgi:hypothetical protein